MGVWLGPAVLARRARGGGNSLLLIAAMAMAAACAGPSAARERWTPEQAWSWYYDQPRLFGANYVAGYAVSPTEMWQADPNTPGANTFDIERMKFELDRAQQAGMNTLRTTLSYEVWKADRAGFMNRLEQFLAVAAERGIRPTFIFWDDVNFTFGSHTPNKLPYLGEQADPTPGVHNSQWTGTGSYPVVDNQANWSLPSTNAAPGAGAQAYVSSIIARYAQDERVLMWNLYNEPANFGQSVPHVQELIHASAQWARAQNPVQPISFDVWGAGTDGTAQAESDVVSYHNYSGPASTVAGVTDILQDGRPVFLTEWMARTFGSTIPDILPQLQELGVGAYNWGLVNGDQQTHWPWGSPPQTATTEPPLWFHDLFRRDGTAYLPGEIAMYQHYRLQDTLIRSADSRVVAIQNPSFEANSLGSVPGAMAPGQYAGWTKTTPNNVAAGGTFVPAAGQFAEPVPDGTQAFYAAGYEIAQTLAETLQAGTYYLLQVDVGRSLTEPLTGYEFDLIAGGVELTPLTSAYANPIAGQWTTAGQISQVAAGSPLVGGALEIRLASAGAETYFDNVRLLAIDSLDPVGVTSDFDRDGQITLADWTTFLANFGANLSGYSPAQRFLHGDLDWDGDSDRDDFLLFKSDYIDAHGAAAFDALFAVPEPSGFMLAGIAVSAVGGLFLHGVGRREPRL